MRFSERIFDGFVMSKAAGGNEASLPLSPKTAWSMHEHEEINAGDCSFALQLLIFSDSATVSGS